MSSETQDDGVDDSKGHTTDEQTSLPHKLDCYEDDGTLDLLRLSILHPSLKRSETLLNEAIPKFNRLISEFNNLFNHNFQTDTEVCKLKNECCALTEFLDNQILIIDSIDLEAMHESWGSKASVRQERKEIVNIYEKLSGTLEELLSFLPVKDKACEDALIPKNEFCKSPVIKKNAIKRNVSGETINQGLVNGEFNTKKRSFWDRTAQGNTHVGLYACAPPVRRQDIKQETQNDKILHKNEQVENKALSEDKQEIPLTNISNSKTSGDEKKESTEDEEEEYQRRRNKKGKSKRNHETDWGSRVRTKIDAFKKRTSQGGCVTTLYENPVSRDMMLSLLLKCESYLSLENPSPYQTKVCIETFIAGLETALTDLQQLRVNKTQMRLLHQSAVVLETFSQPSQLLSELKSLQGLLKTFAMF